MRLRISRIILALILVSVVALALLLWAPVRQWTNLRALEHAVPSSTVWFSGSARSFARSGHMNERLEKRLIGVMGQRMYLSLFEGPVEAISIMRGNVFDSKTGDIVARFPQLRAFSISLDDVAAGSEADWTRLCQGLRSCPRLEAVNFSVSETLTDAAIVPLADHPRLEDFSVLSLRLTPAFLASLPSLKRLVFSDVAKGTSHEFTEAQWMKLCADLRAMPRLEELLLSGHAITDAALVPLTGHPSLRKGDFTASRLSAGCLATFASMPSLKELGFYGGWSGAESAPDDVRKTLSAALPKVKLTFSP